jgi:hypothetical protein
MEYVEDDGHRNTAMRRTRVWLIVSSSVLVLVLVVHVIWFTTTGQDRNQRARHCKGNLLYLRSLIDDYEKDQGVCPQSLPDDLRKWVADESRWNLISVKYLRNPLDTEQAEPRFVTALDRNGGWYYNPATGNLSPNSPPVRLWIWPLVCRVEDPTSW